MRLRNPRQARIPHRVKVDVLHSTTMKESAILTIVAAVLICAGSAAQPEDAVTSLVGANDSFAFRLYSDLAKDRTNLVVSPFGLSMALAMASAGATGSTLEEMRRTLAVNHGEAAFHQACAELRQRIGRSLKDGSVTLDLRNAIWLQKDYDINEVFSDTLATHYRARLNQTDFRGNPAAALDGINTWIREATRGRVKNMLGPESITADTRFILVNTIFFKGRWHSKFERGTRQEPFFVTPEQRVAVPMMFQKNKFRSAERDGVSILELPYVDAGFSMVIFLPKNRDGLGDLERILDAEHVNKWLRALGPSEIKVYLPRFSFDSDMPLKNALSRLGMPRAFSQEQADFTRMSPRRPLFLSSVRQRAGIEVDEEGTTAWAATAVGESFGEAPPPPVEVFRADHPFVFMITNNSTGSILFLGRVVNPLEK